MERENNKKILLFGIVGIIGHIIGVIADNVTAYSTDGVDRFVGLPYQITTFYEYFESLFINKSHLELVVGHYLAIFGISLGIYGLWFYYKTTVANIPTLSKIILPLMIAAYFSGVVYHATFAFVGTVIRAMYANPESQDLLEQILVDFNAFTIPLAFILIGAFVIFSIAIIYTVLFKNTIYPKWISVVNPVFIQLLITIISFIMPIALQVFLIISAYNLSVIVFYSALVGVYYTKME